MGDMGDIFRIMKDDRKTRHADNKDINTRILDNASIPSRTSNDGECRTYKMSNQTVNFYPSTGRWHYKGQTFSGGASVFLQWLKIQPFFS